MSVWYRCWGHAQMMDVVLPPPSRVGQELRTDCASCSSRWSGCPGRVRVSQRVLPGHLVALVADCMTLAALIRRGDASHAQAGLGATGPVCGAIVLLWPGLPGGLLVVERHQGLMIAHCL